MPKNNLWKKLGKIFSVIPGKTDNIDKKIIVPAEVNQHGNLAKIKFNDEVLNLLRYWLQDTYDTSDTIKNRIDRYKSLEYAYYNNTIFSRAVNLYTDEVLQEDVQTSAIDIDSPNNKVISYIEEFFEMMDISNERIRDTAFELVLYGDKFWINPTDNDTGYVESISTNPYSIIDILQFNASEESKKKSLKKSYQAYVNQNTRLQMLDDYLNNLDNDYTKYFKTFLFGYHVDKDLFLPPWNIAHFKLYNTQSEFAPFGRPMMINSLAPFRQLQSSKNLMALARATGFPLKVFEVQVDENMDPYSKWEVVNEAREQFNNLGNDPTGKEQFTMNSEIWVPSGLISFNTFESRVNMDQIADVEMLRDDMIMGTDIPKGYLIVDRGAFGNSAQALLAQHKPFARKVFNIQSGILKELTHLIRLQFAMTGDFDYDTPFELKMAFPSVEESSDRLRIKSDTLRLAKDVIDQIGETIGLERGEALPPEIVKQIFTKLSFLDGEDIEYWVDAVTKSKSSEESQLSEKSVNKAKDYISKGIIHEVYFNSKKKLNIKEGIIGQKHYYSSNNMSKDQKLHLEILSKCRDNNKILKD